MKRVLTLVLALALIAGVIGGCNSKPATPSSSAPASTPASSAAPSSAAESKPAETENKDVYPLAGSPEFTYWLQLHANISPFANNFGETDLAKQWQEATGVKLTFEHPSGTSNDQMLESLNIIFASGKYPDLIHFEWSRYPGGVEKLYNEGVINVLNDAIKDWMPNLSKVLDSNPDYARLSKSDDGSIYKVPMLMDGPLLTSTSGPMVRKDLLDKYSLAVPETVADWDKYLDAIKGDVETPYILQYTDLNAAWVRAWGIAQEFYNDNGTIKFGAVEPAFKDFLTQMNDWYTRGLFDRNFTTTDRKAVDTAMAAGLAGATRGSGGQQLGAYVPLLQKNVPGADLAPAPYPVLNKGDKVKYNGNWLLKNTGNVTISKTTKDFESAARFLDYLYGEEGNMLANYGVEGKTYDMVNGEPTYSDFIKKPTDGKTFAQALSNWTFSNWNGPFVQNEPYLIQYYELPQQQQALVEWNKIEQDSKDLSPLTMTPEEASEYARLFKDIKSYADENIQLFIKGDKPLSEFDKFVADINSMNLARCIEIYQAALERFNSR